MVDNFFTVRNCQRCGRKLVARIMSWFTTDAICIGCASEEDKIKKELRASGVDVSKLEGCRYVPKLEEFKMNETARKCPRCKRVAKLLALSRRDNKTMICSNCGTQEAIFDYEMRELERKERAWLKKQ